MTNTTALTDHIREANELMLHQHGANHLGAGYTRKAEEAWLQYALMMQVVRDPTETGHVLDLGCGFAHLLDYIRATPKFAHLTYTGVDLSAEFLAAARERHPEADLRCLDLLQDASQMPEVDYVIMNGVFNYRGEITQEDMLTYWEKMVLTAFRFAREGIAFNAMSKHVDWERDDLFHLPLDRMAGFVKANLSRHFVIRHDYPAYEYTTFVYRRPWSQE